MTITNEMNPFLKDSGVHFEEVWRRLRDDIADRDLIMVVLSFALGMEQLLKAVLHEVNPVYILEDPTFKPDHSSDWPPTLGASKR